VVDYIRRTAPAWLLPSVTIDQAFGKASRLAGVDLSIARPVDAIRKTRAACLLLHGTADRLLPLHHARDLAAAGAGHDCLILLDGAGHGTIFSDRSGTITRETIAWFEGHLSSGNGP
jgi:pimeloyl-ACP methyl ester carboxylesterase